MKYVRRMEEDVEIIRVLEIPRRGDLGRPVELNDIKFSEYTSALERGFVWDRLRVTDYGRIEVINYIDRLRVEFNDQVYEGDYIAISTDDPDSRTVRVTPGEFEKYYFKERTTPKFEYW